MWTRFASVAVLSVLVAMMILPMGNSVPVNATGPGIQSSISVYLNCADGIAFAEPGTTARCGSGNYTGVYTGVSQTVASNQTSVFFLAVAIGGVKVTFSLTDVTTGKPLLNGVGYGSISGGTCSSPSIVKPVTVQVTTNVINSGDEVRASLGTVFTPLNATQNAAPVFCSGGTSATLVKIGTTILTGTGQQPLTNLLTAGTPYQTTLLGFSGAAETYVDTGSGGFTAVVMGVVKTSSGSTIDVLISSVTVTPGASVTAFLKFNQYPSGTYTIDVIAVTSSNVPVSTVQNTTITV
jgi:hypothetical protein